MSYNQPKLCTDAIWSINATTLITNVTLGGSPFTVFIDGINNLYVGSQNRGSIAIRPSDNALFTRNITGNFNRSSSFFVAINGDVYIDNGLIHGRVNRWIFNSSTLVTALNVNGSCFGLFLDINNLLYCSLRDFHQVIRSVSSSDPSNSTVVAGTGVAGPSPNMLNQPQGIYVDSNLNLYVADCGNNRVQLFSQSSSNGLTVVGNGSSQTSISLNCPTSVTLDQNGYLFVVDSNNHRIIGSNANGYQCVAGCPGGSPGSTASQLSSPQTMAFDSYGNIYVTDRNNNRLQLFSIRKTPCGM